MTDNQKPAPGEGPVSENEASNHTSIAEPLLQDTPQSQSVVSGKEPRKTRKASPAPCVGL